MHKVKNFFIKWGELIEYGGFRNSTPIFNWGPNGNPFIRFFAWLPAMLIMITVLFSILGVGVWLIATGNVILCVVGGLICIGMLALFAIGVSGPS